MPASDLFSDDLLQDVLVQRQISHHTLQSCILFLELAQPPDLAATQVAVLLLPDVERGFGYAKAAARPSLACRLLPVLMHMPPALR